MNAQELIDKILTTKEVEDVNGKVYPLQSNLDYDEGNFIQQLIEQYKPMSTLEVGCAFGISSLFICSKLESKACHIIIDPNQSTDWKNIGIGNLNTVGFTNYTLIESVSELVLPKLVEKKTQLDFALIDGWHTLDHTLIDFFYINRMLKVGGIVVIDDVGMPGIRKIVRYILNYPGYQLIGSIKIKNSFKRNLFKYLVEKPFALIASLLPLKLAWKLFSSDVLKDENKLGINTSMVALRKITDDKRPWNWYKEF